MCVVPAKFRIDVKVNPLDVEEIVWDIASLSRLHPSDVPPTSMMSLPKGQKDRRQIMVRRQVQHVYVLCRPLTCIIRPLF